MAYPASIRSFALADGFQQGAEPLSADAHEVLLRGSERHAWYVLYILPSMSSAERVERFIRWKGFSTYCPRERAIKQMKVRKNGLAGNRHRQPVADRVITKPLLPRYMLVAMPKHGAPFAMLDGAEARAHGIIGFIARDYLPITIPADEVDALVTRERNGEWDDTRREVVPSDVRPEWCQEGQTVRVDQGPLAGFYATVEKYLGKGEVDARLSIFGRQTKCRFTLDQLSSLCVL